MRDKARTELHDLRLGPQAEVDATALVNRAAAEDGEGGGAGVGLELALLGEGEGEGEGQPGAQDADAPMALKLRLLTVAHECGALSDNEFRRAKRSLDHPGRGLGAQYQTRCAPEGGLS